MITAYTSNPGFGYIQLEQTSMEFQGGWLRQAKRSCLLRADINVLNHFIGQNKSLQIPGKIAVQEYAESQVPNDIRTKFLNSKKQSYEETVEQYLKRAGNNGPVLMTGDDRILRFSFYDPTGKVEDIFVSHDNAQEAPSPAVEETADAALPAGEPIV